MSKLMHEVSYAAVAHDGQFMGHRQKDIMILRSIHDGMLSSFSINDSVCLCTEPIPVDCSLFITPFRVEMKLANSVSLKKSTSGFVVHRRCCIMPQTIIKSIGRILTAAINFFNFLNESCKPICQGI